ncbi:hypothetical protein [Bradyrhizobium sp. SZCCHNRI3042]|uniref:hypothetical protein n=1 Tax=Bradyrhizobium sp. SZCCHNRI3042 TaxID=3057291 RepID=UPI0029160B83|nr:hypothetical protein [Bradyrhizobium sp. SZCCHNRI3042]
MPKINEPIAAAEMPTALRIERAPRGGFFVMKPPTDYARISEGPVFACTDIDDALGFIRDELDPQPQGTVGAIKWTEGMEPNAVQPGSPEPLVLDRQGFLADALRSSDATFNGTAPALKKACPHCGIAEGEIVDNRCTAACTGGMRLQFEHNSHGDIFK